jgi:hypothetical protein
MGRPRTLSLIAIGLLATSFAVAAQTAPAQTPAPQTTAAFQARPADVDTIEHILAAVYDVISGPPGPRDWDRFHSLFYTDAKFILTGTGKDGIAHAKMFSADDYIKLSEPYFLKEGFFEVSISNRIENWGDIAHVWSTYESRHAKSDKPFERGINSFQLFNDGKRWWVLNVAWQNEDPEHPIPEKYLSSK